MHQRHNKFEQGLSRQARSRAGFTLLELIMVVAVAGIILTIGALNLRPLGGDLQNATKDLSGFMKQSRAKAMATTSAYRIKYKSPTELFVQQGRTCKARGTGAWKTDTALEFELREGITMTNEWNRGKKIVCFSSRGIADTNEIINLKDKDGKRAEVEVFIGGALEIR